MWVGTLYALAAGLMWGLVFIAPLLLPQYPAALLSCGRYLAFGLIALPLAWADRARLRSLSRADWVEALKLAAVGNLLYYLCLAAAIQRAGAPLPTMLSGTLPVVIAIVSNLQARAGERAGAAAASSSPLPWRRLAPSLVCIAAGIGLVNQTELTQLRAQAGVDGVRYASGVVLAIVAEACWTWYPIRNAAWLRAHAGRSPSTWATAQGIATLPLAFAGCVALGLWNAWFSETPVSPLGATPLRFIGAMLTIGLLASWLGTLCWNEASQRLPTSLVGQLIVFETLSALAYAYMLRGVWPALPTFAGIALLIAGVCTALRQRPEPVAAQSHMA